MGTLSLAMDVARAAGTSVSKASRFISDVGPDAARTTLDAVNSNRKLITGTGALSLTGLAYGEYREQEVELAKAAAEEAAAESDANEQLARLIENDDLSPEVRKELIAEITDDLGNDDDDEAKKPPNPDDPEGTNGIIAALFGSDTNLEAIGGEATKLVILLIIVVFVLNFGLAQAGSLAVNPGGNAV